jgi:hypothetical protein
MTAELEALLDELPVHPLVEQIPDSLKGWVLPIDWDRELLWALDMPVSTIALEDLRWHFDLPWWRAGRRWFQVRPADFLARPSDHPEHERRVAEVNLTYALHVIRRRGHWLIMDGIHRLARAEQLGWETIAVRILEPADIRRIAVPRLADCDVRDTAGRARARPGRSRT